MAGAVGTVPGGIAGPGAASGAAGGRSAPSILGRRRVKDRFFWGCCTLALALVVVPVVWILFGVVKDVVGTWKWSVLWTPASAAEPGLGNAIVGTLMLVVGVGILAGLLGVGCGVFLAEFCPAGSARTVLRSASEVLSGMPSIVFGYVGFVALVTFLGWGYGLAPALVVLTLLVVPYVVKATELALNQVPLAYREGAEALGMTRTYMLRKVLLKAATPGIATGIIVALAISVGETAPLLYTASWSSAWPTLQLTHAPFGYLTYAVYDFYDEATSQSLILAHDAAFLLMVLVLLLILASRLVVRLTQRYAPDRAHSGGRAPRSKRRAQSAS
jgi:phosphate transport system permease protein